MNDDELKVLGAVAALAERDEEATVNAIASEAELQRSAAVSIVNRLVRGGMVLPKPYAYFPSSVSAQLHVHAFAITEEGRKALEGIEQRPSQPGGKPGRSE